jgi:hypothetical protein
VDRPPRRERPARPCEGRALGDLHRRHRVDQRATRSLGRLRRRAHPPHHRSQRREVRHHPDAVAGHRTHVPQGAVGRLPPIVLAERAELLGDAAVLGRREQLCLGLADRWDRLDTHGHHDARLFLLVDRFDPARLVTKSRYISMASSSRPTQRSPPGSLEICWSVMPVPIAVNRSMALGSSMPSERGAPGPPPGCRRRSRTTPPTARSRGWSAGTSAGSAPGPRCRSPRSTARSSSSRHERRPPGSSAPGRPRTADSPGRTSRRRSRAWSRSTSTATADASPPRRPARAATAPPTRRRVPAATPCRGSPRWLPAVVRPACHVSILLTPLGLCAAHTRIVNHG